MPTVTVPPVTLSMPLDAVIFPMRISPERLAAVPTLKTPVPLTFKAEVKAPVPFPMPKWALLTVAVVALPLTLRVPAERL